MMSMQSLNHFVSQFRRSEIKPRDLVCVRLSVSLQPIAKDSIENTATNPAETVQERTERPDQQHKEFAQR
jgi:hypothetical protein